MSILPDPTDPDNILSVSYRNWILLNAFMDDVTVTSAANGITLVKRHIAPGDFLAASG
jgi:hypothetical protein